MAEEDIYGNKTRYTRFLHNLDALTRPGRRYPCANPQNLQYFRRLAEHFAVSDLSYIRRLRLMRSFSIVTHYITTDLDAVNTRREIDQVIANVRGLPLSPRTQADFITDLKHCWKLLFPDQDAQGRPDETITPYLVRHLKTGVDRSRAKRRGDRLTLPEFERLLTSFNDDPRLQAFITLAVESLARPQELLYLRINNVELHDNYAFVYVAEHGKEGPKPLRCIDSHPYVAQWLTMHPCRHDPTAFLFCNLGHPNKYGQLSVYNLNKHLRTHLRRAGIDKPVTSYSLKRNGVTLRVLRGESPIDIQKVAGWTSPQQLRTYDQSDELDAYRRELVRRGLIDASDADRELAISKQCVYCGTTNGYGDTACRTCRRPLDRKKLAEREEEQLEQLTTNLVEAKIDAYMARYGIERVSHSPRRNATGG